MKLPPLLVGKIMRKLGLATPDSADLKFLKELYSSWCMHVPFDNTRKMIALRGKANEQLPGIEARDFFSNWLEHGTGGTCWPMANAFHCLLQSLGFHSKRIAGYMLDMPALNHGSVAVTIGDEIYLAEASLLLNKILALDGQLHISPSIVFPFELEPAKDSYLLWLKTPPAEEHYYCKLVTRERSYDEFAERYETSREQSVFNQCIYVKRNFTDKMVVIWGNEKFIKTADGTSSKQLTHDELLLALENDIGISTSMINKWKMTGALEASFEKHSGLKPPPTVLRPPSMRG